MFFGRHADARRPTAPCGTCTDAFGGPGVVRTGPSSRSEGAEPLCRDAQDVGTLCRNLLPRARFDNPEGAFPRKGGRHEERAVRGKERRAAKGAKMAQRRLAFRQIT